MELVVRDLPSGERATAVHVLASAFADEPYVVELHGPDRAARETAVLARYAAEDPRERTLRLAAYADDVLVGALLGSLPGTCHACRLDPEDDPWRSAVAAAHAHLPAHGWAGRLGVDPSARRLGAGAALLAQAVVRSAALGASTVLECQAHRIAFYQRRGFVVLARVPDGDGEPGAVMQRGARGGDPLT